MDTSIQTLDADALNSHWFAKVDALLNGKEHDIAKLAGIDFKKAYYSLCNVQHDAKKKYVAEGGDFHSLVKHIHIPHDIFLPHHAGAGNIDAVKVCMAYHIGDASVRTEALATAIIDNNVEMAEALIDGGVDPCYGKDSCVLLATQPQHADMMKMLISKNAIKADNMMAIITHAVMENSINVVRILLEYGIPVSDRNTHLVVLSSRYEQCEMTLLLLEHGANISARHDEALRRACRTDNIQLVDLLLTHKANPQSIDNECIRSAASMGHIGIVKLLLKHGANLHARNDEALRLASANGHTEMVEFLLSLGADPTSNDNYAIQVSAANGYVDIVKMLVEYGANTSANDCGAILEAIENNHQDVIKVLL